MSKGYQCLYSRSRTMSVKQGVDAVDYSRKKLTVGDLKEHADDLRKHVLDDATLRALRTDNNYLLRFLYATEFDVTAAFKRMQDLHELRVECPEWFLSCATLIKLQENGQNSLAIHPGRDRSGRRIMIFKIANIEPSKSSPQEQCEITELCSEAVFDEPETLECGVCAIVDMKDLSWKLFPWLTPSNIKSAARKLDLYPFRSIVMHFVNTSSLMNTAIKIIYPFLSDKIKEMFKFHFGNWPSLYDHIEPRILPPEYSGTGPEVNFKKSNEFVFSKAPELEERLKCFQSVYK